MHSILYINADKLCVKNEDRKEYCISKLKGGKWTATDYAGTIRETCVPIG